jgi:hypothetical protein
MSLDLLRKEVHVWASILADKQCPGDFGKGANAARPSPGSAELATHLGWLMLCDVVDLLPAGPSWDYIAGAEQPPCCHHLCIPGYIQYSEYLTYGL